MGDVIHQLKPGETVRARLDGVGGIVLDLIRGTEIVDSTRHMYGLNLIISAAPDVKHRDTGTMIRVDFENRKRVT